MIKFIYAYFIHASLDFYVILICTITHSFYFVIYVLIIYIYIRYLNHTFDLFKGPKVCETSGVSPMSSLLLQNIKRYTTNKILFKKTSKMYIFMKKNEIKEFEQILSKFYNKTYDTIFLSFPSACK